MFLAPDSIKGRSCGLNIYHGRQELFQLVFAPWYLWVDYTLRQLELTDLSGYDLPCQSWPDWAHQSRTPQWLKTTTLRPLSTYQYSTSACGATPPALQKRCITDPLAAANIQRRDKLLIDQYSCQIWSRPRHWSAKQISSASDCKLSAHQPRRPNISSVT